MEETITVQQTWHYGGTEARYRLCIMPQRYYIMTGPYAGPYATRAAAEAVAEQLGAAIAAARTPASEGA